MGILRTNTISGDETQLSTLGIGTTAPVTGSVFFDGNGDFLSLASSGDFELGNGSFTLEAFVYANSWSSSNGGGGIIGKGNTTSLSGEVYTLQVPSGIPKLWIFNSSGTHLTPVVDSGVTLATNVWYHIAVTRDGSNNTRIFIDGILKATSTENYSITTGGSFYVGTQAYNPGQSDRSHNGFISNLRVLKGTALYTANFTPPTLILEPIQDTVLLCCNNPDSAAAVSLAGIGTSKTITVNGNAVASTFNPGLVRNFTSGTQFTGVTRLDTQGYIVPPSGTTEQRNRGRGLFGGGYVLGVANQNVIDYITIPTTGIAQDFGDLTLARRGGRGSLASSTRGIWSGGFTSGDINTIDFVTISSTGNAVDFGDSTESKRDAGGLSNSTRGIFGGGFAPSPGGLNTIDFITIATLGNAQDFGDLLSSVRSLGSCSSTTRGVWGGEYFSPAGTHSNVIQFVTIATLGNSSDFGDLTQARSNTNALSNATRGLWGGGAGPTLFNIIDFITISTTGNASDFGDLTQSVTQAASAASPTRGVWGGGATPTISNVIGYVTIMTTGNAIDFGDLTVARDNGIGGCSDSHGGLG